MPPYQNVIGLPATGGPGLAAVAVEIWLAVGLQELDQGALEARRQDGWRPLSISAHGEPPDERYTVVWAQRPGPAWHATFGRSKQGLASFEAGLPQPSGDEGYAPTMIAAAGITGAIRFAEVWELLSLIDGGKRTLLHLDWSLAQTHLFLDATLLHLTVFPRWGAIYGPDAGRRVAVVLQRFARPHDKYWNWLEHGSLEELVPVLQGFERGTSRTSLLTLSGYDGGRQACLGLFQDDSVGPYVLRIGLPLTPHSAPGGIWAAILTAYSQGLYPIRLQGGAVGEQVYYAAIFAADDQPLERKLTIRSLGKPKAAEPQDVAQELDPGTLELSTGAFLPPQQSASPGPVAPPSGPLLPWGRGRWRPPQPPPIVTPEGPAAPHVSFEGPPPWHGPPPGPGDGPGPEHGPGDGPGPWKPPKPAKPPLVQMDEYVVGMMQHYGIRAGSLAITKRGRLLLSRAYTWAEPGYPITQHTTAFRLGSVSKLLSYMAVMQLIDAGKLSSVHALIADELEHFVTPRGYDPVALNARWGQVRLHHLMRHLTGWAHDADPDHHPYIDEYSDERYVRSFVEMLNSHIDQLPLSQPWATGWPLPIAPMTAYWAMLSKKLTHTPGTVNHGRYSNVDPIYLARLVEEKWNHGLADKDKRDYDQWVANKLFEAAGVPAGRAYALGRYEKEHPAVTELEDAHPANQARFHSWVPNVGWSLSRPDDPQTGPVWAPDALNANWHIQAGPGAWVASSVDLARLLAALERADLWPAAGTIMSESARNLMWGDMGDTPYVTRGGWLVVKAWGDSDPRLLYHHNGLVAGGVSLLVRGGYAPGFTGPIEGLGIVLQLNLALPPSIEAWAELGDTSAALHGGWHGKRLMDLAAKVETAGDWPYHEDLFPYVSIPSYPLKFPG